MVDGLHDADKILVLEGLLFCPFFLANHGFYLGFANISANIQMKGGEMREERYDMPLCSTSIRATSS